MKSGVAPAQAERQRAMCPRKGEDTSHHTAFVQSLLHGAAWQGCGTEGKVQRKQPIKAQSPSCDTVAVYTVGLLVISSEERDISRQKSRLSRIR